MNDGVYQGQCKNDKPHGRGFKTFEKPNQYNTFDGYWNDDKFYNGILVFSNGDSFDGLFR